MKKQIELIIPPEYLNDKEYLYSTAADTLRVTTAELNAVVQLHRSVDARRKEPVFRILTEVYVNETPSEEKSIVYKPVKEEKKVIIG